MSNPIDDGGSIYPHIEWGRTQDGEVVQQSSGGISIRDHFAGLAMQAEMITSFSDATPEAAEDFQAAAIKAGRTTLQHLAHNAYAIADAMLKARGK